MTTEERQQPTELDIISGTPVARYHDENAGESAEKGPTIRKVKVDSLTIYEVTESELEIIERGSPSSTQLNLSIALLSVAVSFLITLLTSDFKGKDRLFTVFTVVTVVSFLGGGVLFLLWYNTKNDVDEVLKKIRGRTQE